MLLCFKDPEEAYQSPVPCAFLSFSLSHLCTFRCFFYLSALGYANIEALLFRKAEDFNDLLWKSGNYGRMKSENLIPVHLAYLHQFGETTKYYPFPEGGIHQT